MQAPSVKKKPGTYPHDGGGLTMRNHALGSISMTERLPQRGRVQQQQNLTNGHSDHTLHLVLGLGDDTGGALTAL
jgi:hypothetical protein